MPAFSRIFFFVTAFLGAEVIAQEVPAYDVWLADVKGQKISQAKRVNTTAGYHNQPTFSRDGQVLFFTSQQTNAAGSQMDIARYHIATQQLSLYRDTGLSEYSPTLLPQEDALSAVVVEADGTQRLWRYPPQGKAEPLLPEVKGVGYHAWGPADDVLLFILGKDEADHQIAYRNSTGELRTLAKNIGRALAWRPGTSEGYFTVRQQNRLKLAKFDSQNIQTTFNLTTLPEQALDLVWWSSDLLLASRGSQLLSWQDGNASWQLFLDLARFCPGTVSRFAFDPTKTRLAFVCQPTPQVKS